MLRPVSLLCNKVLKWLIYREMCVCCKKALKLLCTLLHCDHIFLSFDMYLHGQSSCHLYMAFQLLQNMASDHIKVKKRDWPCTERPHVLHRFLLRTCVLHKCSGSGTIFLPICRIGIFTIMFQNIIVFVNLT